MSVAIILVLLFASLVSLAVVGVAFVWLLSKLMPRWKPPTESRMLDDEVARKANAQVLTRYGWVARDVPYSIVAALGTPWKERERWVRMIDGVLCGVVLSSRYGPDPASREVEMRRKRWVRLEDRLVLFMDLAASLGLDEGFHRVNMCPTGVDPGHLRHGRSIEVEGGPGAERIQAWAHGEDPVERVRLEPNVLELLGALSASGHAWSVRHGVLEFSYPTNLPPQVLSETLEFVERMARSARRGTLGAASFASDGAASVSTAAALEETRGDVPSAGVLGEFGFRERLTHPSSPPWIERERHEGLVDGVPCAVTFDSHGGPHENKNWRTAVYIDLSGVIPEGSVVIESNHPNPHPIDRHGPHWEPLSIECGFHSSHVAAWTYTGPVESGVTLIEPLVRIPEDLARELYELADAGVSWMITRRTLTFRLDGRASASDRTWLMNKISSITKGYAHDPGSSPGEVVLDMEQTLRDVEVLGIRFSEEELMGHAETTS